MSESLLMELRRRYPGLGRRADYESSRAAAIKLHCLGCVAGSRREVELCQSMECPFWVMRPYKDDRVRPEGCVPTAEWYEAKRADARAGCTFDGDEGADHE